MPERRPRLAFLFAAVPVMLIGALLASGPLLLKADTIGKQVFVTPVAYSPDPSDPAATPLPLPDWDKKERVNILLLGLDKREDDEFGRTDTMILVSIDPSARTVGIMSLPRDLKVAIPGYPDDKINAAYVFGDLDKYPGGGVGLLRRTITRNFGINVHYYAQVDFRGFEKLVDAFGGVNVDVPYPLKDDEYPTETNGYSGIYFAAGLQHLDGKQALRYARTRHPDNDIARSKRQQEVILSLRQQAANRDLRDLIGKFWPLLDILGTSVRTDLSRDQIIALARLGQGIPRENIRTYSIQDLVSDYTDPETGTDYLLADWTKVRKRVREMVPNATLASPTPDTGAKIAVRNGSQIDQFASRTVDRLKRAGFSGAVVDASPVPGVTAHSAIYDYTGGGETAFAVARALGLPESAVQDGPGAAPNGVGIVVVLGQDAPDTSPRPTVTPTRRGN